MPDLSFRVNADIRGLKNAMADARREVSRGIGSLGGAGGLLTGAGLAAGATKAITDYVERAKDIAKLATLAKASIAEASQLLATGEQFGVTGDKISDALRNVSQAASSTPELFKAIGVELEDANGKGRRNIDIFTDVRNVIANSQGDFRTTAGAAKILGRSVEDLYPFLRASEQQVQKVAKATQDMGLVMSEDAVRGALAYGASLQAAEAQGQSLVRQMVGSIIPALANVTEAAMTAGDMIGALFSTPNKGQQGIPIISGLSNFVTGVVDTLAGNPTDQLRSINDQVNAKAKMRADFEKLAQANLLGGAGGAGAFPSLAGGRDAALDALHDRIDAIKEEADERERAMRKALDAFEAERQGAIRAIQDESDARERQHDLELRAIDDESRARQDAFDAIDRVRQDEVDALREQIRGTQELTDLEKTRADIAAAEGDAEAERRVEIFRSAGQSANDYARAVRDQQKRIADADKRIAESKKKLEEDTARASIEARVRAIEEERQAARRALDEYKRAADERQRSIHDQMDAERRQSDTRIRQIQDEIDNERKRANDEIAQLQDVTRATLKELDEQVKAHQRAGAAIAAAYSNVNRTVTYTTVGGGGAETVNTSGGGAELAQRKGEQSGGGMNLNEARALKEQLLERPIGIEEAAGYVGRTRISVANEIKQSPEYLALQASAAARAAARNRAGGSAVLTAATGLDMVVGPGHGGPQLILAGEGGVPEDVHIGPRGSGGGSVTSTINAYGIGVREAAKLIARENERALARRAGHGYGRRR